MARARSIFAASPNQQLKPQTLSCIVGAIGSLMREAAVDAAADRGLLDRAVGIILDSAAAAKGCAREAAFQHEAMWSLTQIFKSAPSLDRFSDRVRRVANDVVKRWGKIANRSPEEYGADEVMAVRLAKPLLRKVQRQVPQGRERRFRDGQHYGWEPRRRERR